jgi:hypothetical protein
MSCGRLLGAALTEKECKIRKEKESDCRLITISEDNGTLMAMGLRLRLRRVPDLVSSI